MRAIPWIHITDLYHPPQDPDDLFDLATLMAMEEVDLLAVLLDTTRQFLDGGPEDVPREPGFLPVAQLGYLAGRAPAVAIGPIDPLNAPEDQAVDRSVQEQTAVEALLRALHQAEAPVTVSIVASCRILAAALNRDADLVRRKVARVVLCTGSSSPEHEEWNVQLDPHAYVRIMRSVLPIDWYPCASENGVFDRKGLHGTHWQAKQRKLIEGCPGRLRGWFAYVLAGSSRGDILRSMDELGRGSVWHDLLQAKRNMWSTVGLVRAAGRTVSRTAKGWRFLSDDDHSGTAESLDATMVNVQVEVGDDARVQWRESDQPCNIRLFRRNNPKQYAEAMPKALAALLAEWAKQ